MIGSEQIQNEISIDWTIKAEIKSGIEGVCKVQSSNQFHTGYDWKQVKTVLHSATESRTVKSTVPAGEINDPYV